MRITHQFYENSSSGANSYVKSWDSLTDAQEEMTCSIYNSIAHMETETMDSIRDKLLGFIRLSYENNNIKESSDILYDEEEELGEGFTARWLSSHGYSINSDRDGGDQYRFEIYSGDKYINSQFGT